MSRLPEASGRAVAVPEAPECEPSLNLTACAGHRRRTAAR